MTANPTGPPTGDNPTAWSEFLEGTEILVFKELARQVCSMEGDARGRFVVEVAPGVYRFETQPEGLMGTASEPNFSILGSVDASLAFSYETGIR